MSRGVKGVRPHSICTSLFARELSLNNCRVKKVLSDPCTAGNGVLLFPSASELVRDRHSKEQSGCGGETEVAASRKGREAFSCLRAKEFEKVGKKFSKPVDKM